MKLYPFSVTDDSQKIESDNLSYMDIHLSVHISRLSDGVLLRKQPLAFILHSKQPLNLSSNGCLVTIVPSDFLHLSACYFHPYRRLYII